MPVLNENLPVFECLIRNEFLYNFKKGHGAFSKCVVFGVASIPGRAIGFHCLLDNGAIYGRLPVHALNWAQPKTKPIENVLELQLWDAPSEHVLERLGHWDDLEEDWRAVEDALKDGHLFFRMRASRIEPKRMLYNICPVFYEKYEYQGVKYLRQQLL